MNPYIFNFLNGLIFFSVGLWAYSLDFKYAIYFVFLGIILIALTHFVRSSNEILGGAAMMSTLFGSAVLAVLFYSSLQQASFSLAPVGMMLTSGLITSTAFLQCAMSHSKGSNEEECCEQASGGSSCSDNTLSKDENAQSSGCC